MCVCEAERRAGGAVFATPSAGFSPPAAIMIILTGIIFTAVMISIISLSCEKSCLISSHQATIISHADRSRLIILTAKIRSSPSGNVSSSASSVRFVLVSSCTGESVSRAMSSLIHPACRVSYDILFGWCADCHGSTGIGGTRTKSSGGPDKDTQSGREGKQKHSHPSSCRMASLSVSSLSSIGAIPASETGTPTEPKPPSTSYACPNTLSLHRAASAPHPDPRIPPRTVCQEKANSPHLHQRGNTAPHPSNTPTPPTLSP